MKRFKLYLLILFALCACQKNYELKVINPSTQIVAIGDSLTYGYGATSQDKSYPSQLATLVNAQVINEGVNGDTTDDVLTRLDDIINNETPTLVLLSIGGNDMLRRVPNDVIKNNLIKIIQTLKQKNIEVILIAQPEPTIFALNGVSAHDAPFYAQVAQEEKINLISDVWSNLDRHPEYHSDKIHANDLGYSIAAHDIYKALKKMKITK
jgi:acyl-CoA thioesterase I